ncbi:hypothetical protein BI347_04345 [Chromobacterium sphagni]|uniref:Methyltransferase n=2 Tax=Chromobacterium sphagni TaxID=1903179 RepID=A0A1S1WZW7_9NEIS|nr:hypothetical protein BI347_04345 [Chromobacterium sphagni]
MLELTLSKRMALPREVAIGCCPACQFAFVSPRQPSAYLDYYAAVCNDQLSGENGISERERIRYLAQIDALREFVDTPGPLRILDLGCGRAGLLRTMQAEFPQHSYVGCDPVIAGHYQQIDGVPMFRELAELPGSFDVVIMSHVLEHVVDIDSMASLPAIMSPGAVLYVEVPDALRYADCPRREYMYYVDRLHVNHFTPTSLAKVLGRWGGKALRSGRQSFHYKDGGDYPAIYLIAGFDASPEPPGMVGDDDLPLALERYFAQEKARARQWRAQHPQSGAVVAYGFGDNFFRARMAGGPLAELELAGVVDARWRELAQSEHAKEYRFYSLEDAVSRLPDACYMVTLSWAAEEVAVRLRQAGIKNVQII